MRELSFMWQVITWNPVRAAVLLVEALWKKSSWRYPEDWGADECVLKVTQWESCGVVGLTCIVIR